MMKYLVLGMVLLASGCGGDPPAAPEKKTIDKLNSADPKDQKEGLEEADRKYGSGK